MVDLMLEAFSTRGGGAEKQEVHKLNQVNSLNNSYLFDNFANNIFGIYSEI